MPVFKLDKLVKDSVIEYMLGLGQQPEIRILKDDKEYEKELYRKLAEETNELADTDDPVKEMKDILAVVRQIALLKGIDLSGFIAIPPDEPGEFDTRAYVGKLVLKDDDEWVEYYRQEPDRFPEIAA